jgi:hypothetical protein
MMDDLNLPALVRRAPVDLAALAVRIREHLDGEARAFRECLERARESVERARLAGELLKVARDQLKPKHGWHEWLRQQGIPVERAAERIRIADNFSRIPANIADKGVARVLEFLRPQSPQLSDDLTEQLRPTLEAFGYTPPARDEDEGLDEDDEDADAGLNLTGPPPRTPSAVSPEVARSTPPAPGPPSQGQGTSAAPPPPRNNPSNYSIPIPKLGGEPPPESPFDRDRRLLAGLIQSLARHPMEQGMILCKAMIAGVLQYHARLPEEQKAVLLACLDTLGRLEGGGPAGES